MLFRMRRYDNIRLKNWKVLLDGLLFSINLLLKIFKCDFDQDADIGKAEKE